MGCIGADRLVLDSDAAECSVAGDDEALRSRHLVRAWRPRFIAKTAEDTHASRFHGPGLGHSDFDASEYGVHVDDSRITGDCGSAQIEFIPTENRRDLAAAEILRVDHAAPAAEH